MQIKIANCDDINLRKEIRNITEFVMKHFFCGSKILTNVGIHIKIDNMETRQNGAWGLCIWKDDRHKPRKFSIVLSDDQSKKNFTLTLMHELVHVKQYLAGEMKDYKTGQTKWKKTIYGSVDEIEDSTHLPWEKQASKLSEHLYKIYQLNT
jgi:hypothetical protein